MALGYSFNGVCYSTYSMAVDAYYSGIPPAVTSGASTYQTIVEFSGNSGQWSFYTWDVSNGSPLFVSYSPAVLPAFLACETYDTPDAFGDGMLLGWGVVAAIALAWAFTAMRKGL